MNILPLEIPDVKVVEPRVHGDSRGYFLETWSKQKFDDAGIYYDYVQDNLSRSSQGILRGLHYQIQMSQGKTCQMYSRRSI